jgi:hypothetical protein
MYKQPDMKHREFMIRNHYLERDGLLPKSLIHAPTDLAKAHNGQERFFQVAEQSYQRNQAQLMTDIDQLLMPYLTIDGTFN